MVSFKDLERFKDIARTNLCNAIRGGSSFQPVAITETGIVIALQWGDDKQKESCFNLIGKTCREKNVPKVLVIVDACFRRVENPEQIARNWDTERPSTYPAPIRKEALAATVHDLEGKIVWMTMMPYTVKDSVVSFEEESSSYSGGGINDCLLEGYHTLE